MKTTTSILTLALSITTPSVAAWLLAGQPLSPEILSGSYSITGLLFIAMTDYAPRRQLTLPRKTPSATTSWTLLPSTRSNRFRRILRAEKITA